MKFKFYLHEIECGDHSMRELAEQQLDRAQKYFISRGGDWDDPRSPIYRSHAVQSSYPTYKLMLEMGQKEALLYAIAAHIEHDVPLPHWASKRFLRAFKDVTNYRVGSWDDVFGKRLKKGQHLPALRKKHQKAMLVYNDVVASKAHDEPIDFEAIGKKHGVGATLAKEYYREKCRIYGKPGVGKNRFLRPDF